MLCRCVRTVLVESVELERDLLVDLALGEALEHLELARRTAGTGRSGACGRSSGTGRSYMTAAQLGRAEADACART